MKDILIKQPALCVPFWQPQNTAYILKSGPLYWQNDTRNNSDLRGSIYIDLIKINAN